jgi:hypothetical protein
LFVFLLLMAGVCFVFFLCFFVRAPKQTTTTNKTKRNNTTTPHLRKRPLEALDARVEVGARGAQQAQLAVHARRARRRLELGLQLRHDQHRPPPEALFRPQDVAVDVVADVQDLAAAAHAEHRVQVGVVAALKDGRLVVLADVELARRAADEAVGGQVLVADRQRRRAIVGVAQAAVARVDGEERAALAEKAGLGAADDDDVEKLEPVVVLVAPRAAAGFLLLLLLLFWECVCVCECVFGVRLCCSGKVER